MSDIVQLESLNAVIEPVQFAIDEVNGTSTVVPASPDRAARIKRAIRTSGVPYVDIATEYPHPAA